MKYTLSAALLSSIMILASCSDGSSEQNTAPNTYDIELIDNNKWVVDAEMMQHINNINSSIQRFNESNNDDYKALGKELDEHLNLLTSNCTMTGQAHDELHKWLVPFLGMVDDLNETSEKNEASVFQDIESSMEEFYIYFK